MHPYNPLLQQFLASKPPPQATSGYAFDRRTVKPWVRSWCGLAELIMCWTASANYVMTEFVPDDVAMILLLCDTL